MVPSTTWRHHHRGRSHNGHIEFGSVLPDLLLLLGLLLSQLPDGFPLFGSHQPLVLLQQARGSGGSNSSLSILVVIGIFEVMSAPCAKGGELFELPQRHV